MCRFQEEGREHGKKALLGKGITLTVIEVRGNRVWLACDAADPARIFWGELACWHEEALADDLDGKPNWSRGAGATWSRNRPAATREACRADATCVGGGGGPLRP